MHLFVIFIFSNVHFIVYKDVNIFVNHMQNLRVSENLSYIHVCQALPSVPVSGRDVFVLGIGFLLLPCDVWFETDKLKLWWYNKTF